MTATTTRSIPEIIGWTLDDDGSARVWCAPDGSIRRSYTVDDLLAWLRAERVYPTISVGPHGCAVECWRAVELPRVEPFHHSAGTLLAALEAAVRAVDGAT